MKERFEKLADDMMTAAQLTGFRVMLSRSESDVSATFGKAHELYGCTCYGNSTEYRCLGVDDEYTYFKTEAEFVAMLIERFREYGVDFNEIRERTAA
jgi:hypothetical protein